MDSKEFKNIFDKVAKVNSFEKAFGGWFMESAESIVVLDLQKSNFGNYYDLNVKIYIQGMFGNSYAKNKDLVKKETGDVFRRHPEGYKDVFDFDMLMEDVKRKERLESLFSEFIMPFTHKALSKSGIKELAGRGEVFLLPTVKKELQLI
jgi:hypothetical protein